MSTGHARRRPRSRGRSCGAPVGRGSRRWRLRARGRRARVRGVQKGVGSAAPIADIRPPGDPSPVHPCLHIIRCLQGRMVLQVMPGAMRGGPDPRLCRIAAGRDPRGPPFRRCRFERTRPPPASGTRGCGTCNGSWQAPGPLRVPNGARFGCACSAPRRPRLASPGRRGYTARRRVISSAGRALRLHRRCREFESLITHHLRALANDARQAFRRKRREGPPSLREARRPDRPGEDPGGDLCRVRAGRCRRMR